MTKNIYPPDHLLGKWEELIFDGLENVNAVLYEAFQAGADQELEACCEWAAEQDRGFDLELRATRRPKPPRLAEEALEQLSGIRTAFKAAYGGDLVDEPIRRALERLQELEGQND